MSLSGGRVCLDLGVVMEVVICDCVYLFRFFGLTESGSELPQSCLPIHDSVIGNILHFCVFITKKKKWSNAYFGRGSEFF